MKLAGTDDNATPKTEDRQPEPVFSGKRYGAEP